MELDTRAKRGPKLLQIQKAREQGKEREQNHRKKHMHMGENRWDDCSKSESGRARSVEEGAENVEHLDTSEVTAQRVKEWKILKQVTNAAEPTRRHNRAAW